MALTASGTSSLNSWSDSIATSYLGVLSVLVTDSLNNWADSTPVKILHGRIIVTGDLNSWEDTLQNIFERGINESETLTFSDAVLVTLLGDYFVDESEDLNAWTDTLALTGHGRILAEDTINLWNDDPNLVIGTMVSVVSDLNSWDDSVLANLCAELLVSVSSNLDNWEDSHTENFLSRLEMTKRKSLIPYLRRYLNDKEETVKELSISVQDGFGFEDTVG